MWWSSAEAAAIASAFTKSRTHFAHSTAQQIDFWFNRNSYWVFFGVSTFYMFQLHPECVFFPSLLSAWRASHWMHGHTIILEMASHRNAWLASVVKKKAKTNFKFIIIWLHRAEKFNEQLRVTSNNSHRRNCPSCINWWVSRMDCGLVINSSSSDQMRLIVRQKWKMHVKRQNMLSIFILFWVEMCPGDRLQILTRSSWNCTAEAWAIDGWKTADNNNCSNNKDSATGSAIAMLHWPAFNCVPTN